MTDEPTGVRPDRAAPTCYRHPDREAHVLCQRCGRNICGDCMRQASVGFQCPDCVQEGARTTRQPRTAFGGRPPAAAGRVTLTLIAINVVVFVLILGSGGRGSDLLLQLWLVPQDLCYDWTANGCLRVAPGVSDGAYWQVLTAVFTHVEVWHIGFNMLALYILGPQLELVLGHARFLALYILSGLFGSATVLWLAPDNSATVGASGAIFGLMAALLIVAVRVGGNVQGLLTLVAINVAITVFGASFISWQGHLGGFVGGLLLAAVLVYAPRRHRTLWQLLGCGAVAAVVVLATVARTLALT